MQTTLYIFFFPPIKSPTWQRGNGGSHSGRPLCGFFTVLKFQKQVISLWSEGMETAKVGNVVEV